MASMQEATVIIIGAGAAGIYAARSLREKGCKNVIVLEARERAGMLSSSIKCPLIARFILIFLLSRQVDVSATRRQKVIHVSRGLRLFQSSWDPSSFMGRYSESLPKILTYDDMSHATQICPSEHIFLGNCIVKMNSFAQILLSLSHRIF